MTLVSTTINSCSQIFKVKILAFSTLEIGKQIDNLLSLPLKVKKMYSSILKTMPTLCTCT